MLEDYFTDLEVYSDQEIDWDNPPTDDNGTLAKKADLRGFVQTRAGSRSFQNQALAPNSTHILYCPLDADLIEGDYILFLEEYYLIEYIPPKNGISGVYDHLECALVYQHNIEVE